MGTVQLLGGWVGGRRRGRRPAAFPPSLAATSPLSTTHQLQRVRHILVVAQRFRDALRVEDGGVDLGALPREADARERRVAALGDGAVVKLGGVVRGDIELEVAQEVGLGDDADLREG